MVDKKLKEALAVLEYAIIISGNLTDIEPHDGRFVYRLAFILDVLQKLEFAVLCLQKSALPRIYRQSALSQEKQTQLEKQLQAVGLWPLSKNIQFNDVDQSRETLGKLTSLLLTKQQVPVFLVFKYIENWVSQPGAGLALPEQQVMEEFFFSISSSPSLKKAGNGLLGLMIDGQANICSKLRFFHEIELPYPGREELLKFLEYAQGKKQYGQLAAGLTTKLAADLGRGLPVFSLQKSLRHAKLRPEGLTAEELLSDKAKDFIKLSKGGLRFEPPSDLQSFADVVGHENVKRFFQPIIKQMRTTGQSCKPVCLTGPPGSGKSALATAVARECGLQLLVWHQTKHGLVGDSEKAIRLCRDLTFSAAPIAKFIDEADKSMPRPQSGVSDGGVSDDALSVWQQFLADPRLTESGVLVLAATNVPGNLATAVISRFIFLPVFPPGTPDQIVELILHFIKRLKCRLPKPDMIKLKQSAQIFLDKGVDPREIYNMVDRAKLKHGPELTNEIILNHSEDAMGNKNSHGVDLAICQSVAMCSYYSALPFAHDENYILPKVLQDVVDIKAKKINWELLNRKIEELRPYANL